MQAARWYGPRDVRVETVPDPEPALDGVVLRVDWCGICGTDVEEYLSGPHWVPTEPNALTGAAIPLILGHEFAGQVVRVGPAVRSLRVGDRVAVDTLIYCGRCYWCLRHQVNLCEKLAALGLMADGGLADYCAAPESTCVVLPDSLRTDQAALAETLAVGVHALRRGRLAQGETVAVIGAGAVGLCALQAALHGGARRVVVVEPNELRRGLALRLGAALVVDSGDDRWLQQVHSATDGRGPDLVLECGGRSASLTAAIAAVRRGGRVVLIGTPRHPISLDFATIAVTEKELIGSLSHVYDEDFSAAVELLADGRVNVDALITHRLRLDDVVSGFERLAAGEAEAIKILIGPSMLDS